MTVVSHSEASALAPVSRYVDQALQQRRRLLEWVGRSSEPDRILIVIPATFGAEAHLLRTVPRILLQVRRSGRWADILIGLNHGFEAPRVERLAESMADCDLTLLDLAAKQGPAQPAAVYDLDGTDYLLDRCGRAVNRIFLLRQPASPFSQGKIRVMGDIYGLVERSIEAGWNAHPYVLAMDAESELVRPVSYGRTVPDECVLLRMLDRLESDRSLEAVGAINRFTAYEPGPRNELIPAPDVPIPGMQLFMNMVHGKRSGFMWLPGGATLWRLPTVAAFFSRMAAIYYSTRIEDVLGTVALGEAGLRTTIEPSAAALNRCAPRSDSPRAEAQIRRFIGGTKSVEDLFGPEAVRSAACVSLNRVVWAGAASILEALVRCRSLWDLVSVLRHAARLAAASQTFLRLKKATPVYPMLGEDSIASW